MTTVHEHPLEARRYAFLGWLASLVGVAIFVGFVALFWRIGLFDLPETDAGTQAFAAVLGLLGVALTELIAFVALMLKHSLDERAAILAREAEDRLRMETAIKAVGLMGTPEGKEAAASQKAGALMALADLGSVEFSLALLSLIWPTDTNFPSEAAVRVIDRGLLAKNDRTQKDAAVHLAGNADRLSEPLGVSWPQSWSRRWHEDAVRDVREQILQAAGAALIAICSEDDVQIGEDDVQRGKVNVFFVLLNLALQFEENPRIRAEAASLLVSLAPLYGEGYVVLAPDGDISVAEVFKTAEEAIEQAGGPIASATENLAARLMALVTPGLREQVTVAPSETGNET